ncbi:MAG TPA: hypothetical protein VFL96_08460 [Acidobacteriaceae bacterium]|nr:hypothetical protein [Acidobacteriaceae bacterium]
MKDVISGEALSDFDAEEGGKVDIARACGQMSSAGSQRIFDETKNNFSGINLLHLTPPGCIPTIEKTYSTPIEDSWLPFYSLSRLF